MTSLAVNFGARYLVEPARFPNACVGTRWGTGALALDVAGERFCIRGLSARQEQTLRQLWPRFETTDPSTRVRIDVFRAEASSFQRIDVRNWGYDLDIDHREDAVRMVGLDFMADVRLGPPMNGAFWTSAEKPRAFHGAFENFFRLLTAYSLLERKGVLFHSAAVVGDDGSARLFVGQSGAGKSTVSKLARASERLVLSDDLNSVLVGASGTVHVAGSPFFGELGARIAGSYPLAGIYRLKKAASERVQPMSPAETIASLLSCSPFVNRDPHRAEALWKNLATLAERVPGAVLSFRRHADFWPLLREGEAS